MNVILVGGAGDGGRLVLPDGQTRYELMVYNKLSIAAPVSATEPLIYETQHYNLFPVHPVTRAVVFALETLTPTQIMERLLEHYAPTDGPKGK